jgi:hypothetical protein
MMLASAGGAVLAGCGGGGGGGGSDSVSNSAGKGTTSSGTSSQAAGSASAASASTSPSSTSSASTSPNSGAGNSNASTPDNTSPTDNTQPGDNSNSRPPVTPNSLFYGVNGHMAYNSGIYNDLSAAQQLAILQDLGVTNYRCDIAGAGMARVLADALTGAFANSGVAILPVLNPRSAGWDPDGSESAAYQLGYNLGVHCATPLRGLVKYIECGNELDSIGLKIAGDGSHTSDWNPSQWPSFRGVTRGMIDGVKAVDSSIECGVNVGIPMAYRALQMLWDGITPDGTAQGVSGAASLRWDFTSYHWYHSSGDIECAGINNACVNVLQVLRDSFNVPIWLTEWGWNGQNDTPQIAQGYVQWAMEKYHRVRTQYNIQTIMLYAVIDESYGLLQDDGVTRNGTYQVFKDFIAANPVH